MRIATTCRVQRRNSLGQFARACSRAGELTIEDAIDEGADLSRSLAPVGTKVDPRTTPLRESIHAEMVTATAGRWYAEARHALDIEYGAGPHDIPAEVSFYWEKMGRMWMWPETYLRVTGKKGADPIKHPGNAAQPYLEPAYRAIMSRIISIADRYYPG